jgi:hypothetical protein
MQSWYKDYMGFVKSFKNQNPAYWIAPGDQKEGSVIMWENLFSKYNTDYKHIESTYRPMHEHQSITIDFSRIIRKCTLFYVAQT